MYTLNPFQILLFDLSQEKMAVRWRFRIMSTKDNSILKAFAHY